MSTENNEDNKTFLGVGIKRFRKAKNLTLKELADIIGSSPSYISEIERGLKTPGGEFIMSLKRNFKELDLNKLFQIRGTDDPILDDLTIKEPDEKPTLYQDYEKQMLELVRRIERGPWSKTAKFRLYQSCIEVIDTDFRRIQEN